MSSSSKPAPKHRAPKERRAPKAALKTSLTLSGMAVVATGFAVGTGQLVLGGGASSASTQTAAADVAPKADASAANTASQGDALSTPAAAPQTESTPLGDAARREVVTRSSSRVSSAAAPEKATTKDESVDQSKVDSLSLGSGNAVARTESLANDDPHDIAKALLSTYGWSEGQYGCLDSLWTRESGWRVDADNPTSSAYGIPQALPGSKMSSMGADWATNPVTQIKWGLWYIQERYGSPCGAWGHSQATGFY